MKRLGIFLILIISTFIFWQSKTNAAPSGPISLQYHNQFVSWPEWDYLIESQPMDCPAPGIGPSGCNWWVGNPEPGAVLWNIDDLESWAAYGSLGSNESFSIIERTIIDNRNHLLWISANVGRNRSAILTINFPEWGASYSRQINGSGSFCLTSPYSDLRDLRFIDIPGSKRGNFLGPYGRGLPAHFVWTLINTDRRAARDITFLAQVIYPNLPTQQGYCGGTTWTPLANGLYLVGL